MKKSFHIILLFSLLVTASCNNSAGADGKREETGAAPGKGTITCGMDGKQRTFTVQQGFFEISLDPYAKGAKDGIEILDGDTKKEGFQFEIKKSGTTTISNNASGDIYCIINYYNPEGIVYTGKHIVVNVISYDQKKLTGTFSGTLVNVHYGTIADKYPELIQITDGKLELER